MRHRDRVMFRGPRSGARRIVVNLVRSAHRYRKVRELRPVETSPAFVESRNSAVDERMRMTAALSILSPARRATVVLRLYEDMTEHQIAAALDRPLGTVKSDLHRALKQLRPILQNDDARE